MMLQRQPEIARAPEPHGISYWCWVVVDAVVNVVAILLAATLFALPLLLIARVDRLGVVFVALAVSGQLGGLAVLIWLSIRLKGRRILGPLVSLTGELALLGGLAAILVGTL